MKKIDLGQTMSTVANIGVIAGIAFLAVELNQNRDLMRAQIRHELSLGAIDYLAREATNGELAEVVQKAYDNEPLNPVEARRFRYQTSAWFRYVEDVNYQYRNGLYDDSEFATHRETWRGLLAIPAVRDHWCETRGNFSPGLQTEFADLLARKCSE
jgi:hypothetical protein